VLCVYAAELRRATCSRSAASTSTETAAIGMLGKSELPPAERSIDAREAVNMLRPWTMTRTNVETKEP
jgi:hypothetical protein